jgi:hypothetical protein
MDAQQRYCAPQVEADGWSNAMDRKETWVAKFKDAMKARYGKDFDKLDNICDLKALLAGSPKHPVHYPRSTEEPAPEGENYKWFVQNKKSGSSCKLPLAAGEDDEGLPLL